MTHQDDLETRQPEAAPDGSDQANEKAAKTSSSEKEKEKRVAPPKKSGEPIEAVLGDSWTVRADMPMPHLNHGPVKAYQAFSSAKKNMGNLFAYVCEPHLVPRYRKINIYESVSNSNTCSLVKHGTVYWPPAKAERYVFIYLDNLGARLMLPGDSPALGMKAETVIDKVLRPLVHVLQDFRDRDFAHGSINPANIFNGGSVSLDHVILGECLATPSSYNQAALYETIERGMADPIGRGQSLRENDIYSLGATVAALIRSTDPTEDMSDEQIIKMKMDVGSYGTLAGKDRFTGSILDFLRGTLHDDPVQRWNIENIMGWLDGQRLTPKQIRKRYKATRPIPFNDSKFLYPSLLAYELPKNPSESRRILEDGDLEHWLTRSIEKNTIFERVEEVVQKTREGGQGKGYEERLAANLSIALHPEAPIRYCDHNLHPEGVGSALAEAYVLSRDLPVFHELIGHGLVMNWVKMGGAAGADTASLISRFDSCRSYLRNDKAGFGLERCLYTLNSEARCLSDKLTDYYVLTPDDLVRAFEDLCSKKKVPAVFLDRHCMAFLCARDIKVIESFLIDLRSEKYHIKVIGQLQTLAFIQKRYKMGPLPHLAAAIVDMLPAVYKRTHDKVLREKMERNINRYADSGDLSKMADIFQNQEVVTQDLEGFKGAMREYRDLSQELIKLDDRLEDKAGFGRTAGREVSAIASSIIAAIVILVMAFLYLSEKSVF